MAELNHDINPWPFLYQFQCVNNLKWFNPWNYIKPKSTVDNATLFRTFFSSLQDTGPSILSSFSGYHRLLILIWRLYHPTGDDLLI